MDPSRHARSLAFPVLVALPLILGGGLLASGCGGGTVTCEGEACACAGEHAERCTCASGTCQVGCERQDCSLTCRGASCDLQTASARGSLHCFGDCTGALGEGGALQCEGISACTVSTGESGSAACRGDSRCDVTGLQGTEVRCEDRSVCTLRCDKGCSMTCGGSTVCTLRCTGGDCSLNCPATSKITCPDGRIVCGGAC